MKNNLKGKLKFLKYSCLFSKNNLFLVCLYLNHKHFLHIRKQLVSNNFSVKFSKNKLLQNFVYCLNIKRFLVGRIFFVYKDNLEYRDLRIIKNLLLKECYVNLIFLDNKLYLYHKLDLLSKSILSPVNKISHLCSFYLLLRLGFFIKMYHPLKIYR